VPHMGWNRVRLVRDCALFKDVPPESEFYFVHSFYPKPAEEFVIGVTGYGEEFCSVHGRDGLWATQFHPEKSGRPGLQILKNFNDYCMERSRAV
jgi:imidazole glycerol-phosphate synthase subunit HisH